MLVSDAPAQWAELDRRIAAFDAECVRRTKENEGPVGSRRSRASSQGRFGLDDWIGKAETFERGRDLAAGWACFRVSSPVGAARLMFLRRERCPEKPSGWARSSTLCTVSCSIIAVFPAGACCLGDETDESGAAFRMLPPVAGNLCPQRRCGPLCWTPASNICDGYRKLSARARSLGGHCLAGGPARGGDRRAILGVQEVGSWGPKFRMLMSIEIFRSSCVLGD